MLILGAVGFLRPFGSKPAELERQIRLSGNPTKRRSLLNLSHSKINTSICCTLHEKILCFGKVFVYLQQNLELCRNTLITLNR